MRRVWIDLHSNKITTRVRLVDHATVPLSSLNAISGAIETTTEFEWPHRTYNERNLEPLVLIFTWMCCVDVDTIEPKSAVNLKRIRTDRYNLIVALFVCIRKHTMLSVPRCFSLRNIVTEWTDGLNYNAKWNGFCWLKTLNSELLLPIHHSRRVCLSFSFHSTFNTFIKYK